MYQWNITKQNQIPGGCGHVYVRCSTGDNHAAAKAAVQHRPFIGQFVLFLALVMSLPAN